MAERREKCRRGQRSSRRQVRMVTGEPRLHFCWWPFQRNLLLSLSDSRQKGRGLSPMLQKYGLSSLVTTEKNSSWIKVAKTKQIQHCWFGFIDCSYVNVGLVAVARWCAVAGVGVVCDAVTSPGRFSKVNFSTKTWTHFKVQITDTVTLFHWNLLSEQVKGTTALPPCGHAANH